MTRELTAREAKAVAELKRLAKHWPQTLKLFSWSGSLVIFDIEILYDALNHLPYGFRPIETPS